MSTQGVSFNPEIQEHLIPEAAAAGLLENPTYSLQGRLSLENIKDVTSVATVAALAGTLFAGLYYAAPLVAVPLFFVAATSYFAGSAIEAIIERDNALERKFAALPMGQTIIKVQDSERVEYALTRLQELERTFSEAIRALQAGRIANPGDPTAPMGEGSLSQVELDLVRGQLESQGRQLNKLMAQLETQSNKEHPEVDRLKAQLEAQNQLVAKLSSQLEAHSQQMGKMKTQVDTQGQQVAGPLTQLVEKCRRKSQRIRNRSKNSPVMSIAKRCNLPGSLIN